MQKNLEKSDPILRMTPSKMINNLPIYCNIVQESYGILKV